MEFDALLMTDMRPDASVYEKDGVELAENLIPVDGDWREVRGRVPGTGGILNLAGYFMTGAGSDAESRIYIGMTNALDTAVYEWNASTESFVARGAFAGATHGKSFFARFGGNVVGAFSFGQLPLKFKPATTAVNFANLVTSADEPRPRFIATSKSHLVGARNEGGAGIYAAVDARQFMWSARNNAAVFTPGTDRSGFGFLRGEDGRALRGLVGFQEYFILFEDYGVHRATWTGGPEVWELQQIAAGRFGINFDAWEQSVVRGGRDVFYLSTSGPAVIVNGESAEPLGDGLCRRFLMNTLGDYGIDQTTLVHGVYEAMNNAVVWTFLPAKNSSSGGRVQLVYNVAERRISILEPTLDAGFVAILLGQHLGATSTYPLDRVRLLEQDGAGAFNVGKLSSPSGSLPMRLKGKIWRPKVGERASLQLIRPVWRVDKGLAASYPLLSIDIERSNDPTFETGVLTTTLTTATLDANGYILNGALPMEAGYFRFTPKTAANAFVQHILDEFLGLELGYAPIDVF